MAVYTLVFAALCVFLGACWRLYVWAMKADDRRDPFGPEDDPDGLPPLGEMPPGIAHEPSLPRMHEAPTLGDAAWLPQSSPAALTHASTGDPYVTFCTECWSECAGGDPCSCCESAPSETSPVTAPAPPASPAGASAGPGTAAAAGSLAAPAPAPPPLPAAIVTYDRDPAQIAAEAPWATPFCLWDPTFPGSDAFVERVTAIRDRGDEDWPVSAPEEWHAEMEADA